MKEILRIRHAKMENGRRDVLKDYSLEIRKGEIIYIQGAGESGIFSLLDFFSGTAQLLEGEVHFNEKKERIYTKEVLEQHGIYTITAQRDLIKTMTVAENMEVIRRVKFPFRFFDQKRIEAKAEKYVSGDVRQTLENWGSIQCQRLSVLKAKMHQASLIVLDCTRNAEDYEGNNGEALMGLIRKLALEGTSFLIISEKYLPLSQGADRIQLLYQGRDLFEWYTKDGCYPEKLLHFPGNYPVWADESAEEEEVFCEVGLFDYEWEPERGIWKYLATLREEAPELWEKYIYAEIPPEKRGWTNGTVIIPRGCEELLFFELSVEDNITMCIADRVGYGHYGFVRKKFQDLVVHQFYERWNIPEKVTGMDQLTRLQKKLLFIYRMEITRPRTMVLESPFAGIREEDVPVLKDYIKLLEKKGIRILIFSRLSEEIQKICKRMLISRNGKEVYMTDAQKLPYDQKVHLDRKNNMLG